MSLLTVCAMLSAPVWFLGQEQPPPQDTEIEEPGFRSVLEGAKAILDAVGDAGSQASQQEPMKTALVLTARSAVEMALRNNPLLATATADLDAARALVNQAKAPLFPQLSVSSAYRFQEGADEQFGSSFLTDLIAPGGTKIKNLTRADRFQVRQVLYAGGQLKAAIRTSKYLAQSEAWRRVATLDTIEFQTKQAYYDCVLAKALLVVAQDSVNTFRRHRDDSQQMLDVGLVSRFEVTRAETELGSREADVVEAGNRVRLAYTYLRRLLALPQDVPLTLSEDFEWVPLDKTVGEYVDEARKTSPEVLALQKAIEAGQEDVRRPRGQFRPRVSATTDFTALDDAGSFVPEGWSSNVGVEWQFYAGGRRRYEVREAKARLQSLVHQREDIELLVEFDLRQAHIQVQDAIAKIRREDGNVGLAREGQRLAALRFQEGIHTQADVLDAELALTSAETQLVVALREYAVAHAALDKALSRSWYNREDFLGPAETKATWKTLWR